jgi:hypothetical protein
MLVLAKCLLCVDTSSFITSRMPCYSKRTLPTLDVFQKTGTPQVMGLQASVPVDHGVQAERINTRLLLTTTSIDITIASLCPES